MPPRKIRICLSNYLDKTDQSLEASLLSHYIGRYYSIHSNGGMTSWHNMRSMLEKITGRKLRGFGQIPLAIAKKDFPDGIF